MVRSDFQKPGKQAVKCQKRNLLVKNDSPCGNKSLFFANVTTGPRAPFFIGGSSIQIGGTIFSLIGKSLINFNLPAAWLSRFETDG